MKKILYGTLAITTLSACHTDDDTYDASGTFEAVETIISAEASGVIREFNIEEGQRLKAGETIGYIDSTQLYLKKKQLQAQINTVLSKKPDMAAQIAALQEQLRQAKREQKRLTRLVEAEAATQKQLDDANSQVEIIEKQIGAQRSSLGSMSQSLTEETASLNIQIQQLNDQMEKCRIINEVGGTVLTKYAEESEMASVGKPLYKLANLTDITLRAYITGTQFSQVKLGQEVQVLVDSTKNSYKTYPGTIQWISDEAEFTPKTIQTKDERANLVYAVKIRVENDGYLKIGMYGEVKL